MGSAKCYLVIAMTILAGCSAISHKRDAIVASGTFQATIDADIAVKAALASLTSAQISSIFATDAAVAGFIQQTTVPLANAEAKLAIASSELNKAIALLNGTLKTQLQSCKTTLDDSAGKIQASISTLANITTAAAFKTAISSIVISTTTISTSVSAVGVQLTALTIQLQAAIDAIGSINIDLSDLTGIAQINVSIDLSSVINIAKQVLAALGDLLQILATVLSSLPNATAQTFATLKGQLIAALNALLTNITSLIAAAKSALQQASSNLQLQAFLGIVVSTCEGAALQINAFINLVQSSTSPATLKLILDGFGTTLTAGIQATVKAVANAIAQLTVTVQTTGSSAIIQATVDAAAALHAALSTLATIKTQASTATDATVSALIQQTISILSNIYIKLTLASSQLSVAIATVTGTIQTQLQTVKSSIGTVASNINTLLSSLASVTTAADFNSVINNIANACNSSSINLDAVKDQLVSLKVQLDAAIQAAAQFDLTDLLAVSNINASTDLSVFVNASKDLQVSLVNLGNIISSVASSIGSASTSTFQTLKAQLIAALNDLLAKVNALSSAANSASASANIQLKAFLTAIISTCEGIKIQISSFITLVQGTATPATLKLILDGISVSIYAAIKTTVTVIVNAVIKMNGGIAPIVSSAIIQATVDAAAALKAALTTLAAIKAQASTSTDVTVSALIQQTITILSTIYIKLTLALSKLSEAIAVLSGPIATQLQSIKASIGTIATNINALLSSITSVSTAAGFNTVINNIVNVCTTASGNLNTVKDQLVSLKVQLDAALDAAVQFDLSDFSSIANLSSLPDLTALIASKESLEDSLNNLVSIIAVVTSSIGSATTATFISLKAQLTAALNDVLIKVNDLITAATSASASANLQFKAFLTAVISSCEGIKLQISAFIALVQATTTPANLKVILDGVSVTLYAAAKATSTIVINALAKLGGAITGGSSSLLQASIKAAAALQAGVTTLAAIASQAATATDATVPALIQQCISTFVTIYVKITFFISKLSETAATVNGTVKDNLQEFKLYADDIAASIIGALKSLANVTTAASFNTTIINIVNACNSASITFNSVKDTLISVKDQLDAAIQAKFDLTDLPGIGNITSASIDLTVLINAAQTLQTSLSNLDNIIVTVLASLATATTANFQSLQAQLTAPLNDLLVKVNVYASAATNILANAGANIKLQAFLTAIISTCEGLKVQITALITLVQGANTPANLKLILDGISNNLYASVKVAVTVVINAVLKISGGITNTDNSAVIQATIDAAAALQAAIATLATIKAQAATATDATVSALIQQTASTLLNIYVKLTIASSKLGEAISAVSGTIQAQLQTIKASIDTVAGNINSLLTSLASVTTTAGFNAAISNIVSACTTASSNLNAVKDQLISMKVQLEAALQAAAKFDLLDLLAIVNLSSSGDVTALVNAGKNLQVSLASLASFIGSLSSSLGSASAAIYQTLKVQLTSALNDLLAKVNALVTAATSVLASANVQLKAFLTVIISTCEGIKIQISAFITLVQGTATAANLKLILDGVTTNLYSMFQAAVKIVANAVIQLGGGVQTTGADAVIQAVVDASTALKLAVTAIASIKASAATATDATFSALIQQTIKILVNVYIKLTLAITSLSDAITLVSGPLQVQLQGLHSICQGASVQILAAMYTLATVNTTSALQVAINTISTCVVTVSASLSDAKDVILSLKANLETALQALLVFDLSDLTAVAQILISSDITIFTNAATSLTVLMQNVVTVVNQVLASLSTATPQTLLSLKVQISNAFNSLIAAVNAVIAAANALLTQATDAQLKAYLTAIINTCNDILIQVNAGLNIANAAVTPESLTVILTEISSSLLAVLKIWVNLVVKAIAGLRSSGGGGFTGIIKFILKLFGITC